ncbi:MAG: hypothetical protein WAK51_15090 [Opitutaceae bacterium]
MASSPISSAPWQSGIRGARANLFAGLVLQLMAVALVLGFYNLDWVHSGLERLVEVRRAMGLAFGVLSTGLCGGILPFLYLRFGRRDESTNPRYSWLQGAGLTAFWAYKGIEVDFWYRIQAHVVGLGHDPATVAIKVVLDQFVYCPVLAVPVTAAIYQAVDSRYDWKGLLRDVREPHWYRRRVLPVLLSNLGVWVPAVAIIYTLPTPLQLPLQNIILCFFTLVVAHQTQTRDGGIPASCKLSAQGSGG